MDAATLTQFKENQKQAWSSFTPLEAFSTPSAARLVRHAGVRAGHLVLDVACGTGVVAITAARSGAHVSGLDLTPPLVDRARENAQLAGLDIDFRQGDVEELPYDARTFDVVLSQFGHMFAPRPEIATREMLRVLKPGGTIAFSTWPPELFVGRFFAVVGRYAPPPPAGFVPPPLWGDPGVVRERLGSGVKDIAFDRERLFLPVLSLAHCREFFEKTVGLLSKLVEAFAVSDPARLADLRRDIEVLIAEFSRDNLLREDYLMTRATKV